MKRDKRIGKNIRRAMLYRQQFNCAVCSAFMPSIAEARCDQYNNMNQLLCLRCMVLISCIRQIPERGITLDDVTAYLASASLDLPDAVRYNQK